MIYMITCDDEISYDVTVRLFIEQYDYMRQNEIEEQHLAQRMYCHTKNGDNGCFYRFGEIIDLGPKR